MTYHQGKTGVGDELDQRQLPDFTLEFVSNLSDDVITVLGEMVKRSLHLGSKADPTTSGRQWVDETAATC